MIAIKTHLKHMPDCCECCQWYGRHPYKGWTDLCKLVGHCMDEDQPEEWIYNGDGRPEACPLIEIVNRRASNGTLH